ncbi:MAG: hypothetical protein A3G24_07205 [Betaproteobacteria bacterium RIFCSPLOWO2_12_FULL_62_13]|nr:MAG: hypothetical protein A3G24_07205 [Betaproteobacteria bacterium RIFCSPLOWO2_12_FULL_62_13]
MLPADDRVNVLVVRKRTLRVLEHEIRWKPLVVTLDRLVERARLESARVVFCRRRPLKGCIRGPFWKICEPD